MKRFLLVSVLLLAGCANTYDSVFAKLSDNCNHIYAKPGENVPEKDVPAFQNCLAMASREAAAAQSSRRAAAISNMHFEPVQAQQPIPVWTPRQRTQTNCQRTFNGMNCTTY